MRPYGVAFKPLDDDILAKRMKVFTCEHLARPGMAMSEFAETMDSNYPLFSERMALFSEKVLTKLENNMSEKILLSCRKLNLKNDQNDDSKCASKNVDMIHDVLTQDSKFMDQVMTNMFELGCSMLSMATHYKSMQYILKNPKDVKVLICRLQRYMPMSAKKMRFFFIATAQ